MRILLTNDDGITAAGFAVLERIAAELSDDVWVCAPESEQSATSHSLTIHRPLRLRELDERRFAVDGTPTDCVLIAVRQVMDRPPDLILSGVNRGWNAGEDITYSGTVAGAMEGTLLGVRSIALSQDYGEDGRTDWSVSEQLGAQIVRDCLSVDLPDYVLLNVNFPACAPDAVKGRKVTVQGNRKIGDDVEERTDPRGRRYYWIGGKRAERPSAPNTDVGALLDGYVSITPLHLDLTHHPTLKDLDRALS